MKIQIEGHEFEHEEKVYYCDGFADIISNDIIGTEYEGQYEIINDSYISHIEVDKVDVIIEGDSFDVTNDMEIIDVAKDEIERYIENL